MVKNIVYNFFLCFSCIGGPKKVYFTENQKFRFRQFFDLIFWLFRKGEYNHNYYAFGLNVKGRNPADYISRPELLRIRKRTEKAIAICSGSENLQYDIITKDKFVSAAFLSANGIPSVPLEGLITKGNILLRDGEVHSLQYLLSMSHDFVLKNTILEAGDGFLSCKQIDSGRLLVNNVPLDIDGLSKVLGKANWVVQRRLESHKTIKVVNNSALNTTRIVTVMNGSEIEYLGGFQSFATGNTEIDSWGKGAIYVGIVVDKGTLDSRGYYHPAVRDKTIVFEHPDSQVCFEEYPLPFLKEALKLCIKAHRLFYNHFIIGWDVAITDDGPLIVEANEKPGMNAVQCIEGGLRNIIRQFSVKTIEYHKT